MWTTQVVGQNGLQNYVHNCTIAHFSDLVKYIKNLCTWSKHSFNVRNAEAERMQRKV